MMTEQDDEQQQDEEETQPFLLATDPNPTTSSLSDLEAPQRKQSPEQHQQKEEETIKSSTLTKSDPKRSEENRRIFQNLQRSSRRRSHLHPPAPSGSSTNGTTDGKIDSVISSLRNSATRKRHGLLSSSSSTSGNNSVENGGVGSKRRRDVSRAPKLFVLLFLAMIVFDVTREVLDEDRRQIWASKPYLFFLKSYMKDDSAENDNDNNDDEEMENNGKMYTSLKDYMKNEEENDNNDDYITIQSLEDLSINGTEYFGKVLTVPPQLSTIADLTTPIDFTNHKPLFWHIPRAGGSTIKDLVARCLKLNQASEVGAVIDPSAIQGNGEVRVVTDVDGSSYVNVDTTSIQGIERAGELNVASFPELHLVVTPFLYEASSMLFNDVNQGRMFALFRHPVDRAVSMYHYLRKSPSHAQLMAGLDTIDDYAKSPLVENNWMTRFLSNQWDGQLTTENELIAKEVLKHKCLVGLMRKKSESLDRFEKFMGWSVKDSEQEECHERLVDWDWSNKNKHELVKEGSDTWDALVDANIFDVRLYRFAEELFVIQDEMFH